MCISCAVTQVICFINFMNPCCFKKSSFMIFGQYWIPVFINNSDWLWVLDPLDGTKDFIQGTGNYAMHLALNYKQKPFLGVVLILSKGTFLPSIKRNTHHFLQETFAIRGESNDILTPLLFLRLPSKSSAQSA